MRIAAGLIFYNDLTSLQRLMPTLKKCEAVYAIDGRFISFPGDSDLSTDGSREYLQSFSNVKLIDMSIGLEQSKRNAFLKAAEADGFDAIFVLDADEYIEGDWDEFVKECNDKIASTGVYMVKVWMGNTFNSFPRLIYPISEFEYYPAHYSLRRKSTGEYLWASDFDVGEIKSIRLWHDDDLRTKDRIAMMSGYQMWQKQYDDYCFENQKKTDRRQRQLRQM
jgi:hypothetical protein